MDREGFDAGQGVLCFLRLPVTQTDQRGDRGDVGEGDHFRIVPPKEPLIHHSGKYMGEHPGEACEKMPCGELSCPFITKLPDGEKLSRHLAV